MIAHITTREAWREARRVGQYADGSLTRDGFIHCSLPTGEQLLAVAHAHFAGEPNLVLLLIEPRLLHTELRYEEFEGSGLFFPHIYGSVNLEAVVRVVDFPPEQDGTFRLPAVLLEDAGR